MSVKKTAFIFPGQGAQSINCLHSFLKHHTLIKECFEEASECLSYNLFNLMQGPVEKLNQTVYTQPFVLTASFALWRLWKSCGGEIPDFLLGHSLGEYTAYLASGSFQFSEAVKLVSTRGAVMQAAVKGIESGMGIIIGLSYEKVGAICREESEQAVVAPTSHNAPDQVVIGGHLSAVHRVMETAKNHGAYLTKQLPISVPAHCDLMKPAIALFGPVLEAVTCRLPTISVVSNHYNRPLLGSSMIKQSLLKQLYQPVRWVDNVNFLLEQGVNYFIECGPNRVLSGMVRKIAKHSVRIVSLNDYERFEHVLMEK